MKPLTLSDKEMLTELNVDEWVSANVAFDLYGAQECQLYRTSGLMQDDLGQSFKITFLIKRHGVENNVYTFYFFSDSGTLIQLGRKNQLKITDINDNGIIKDFTDFKKRETPSSIRIESPELVKVFDEVGARNIIIKTSDYVTREGGRTFHARVVW